MGNEGIVKMSVASNKVNTNVVWHFEKSCKKL